MNSKIKGFLLSLGTSTTVITPIVTVISCRNESDETNAFNPQKFDEFQNSRDNKKSLSTTESKEEKTSFIEMEEKSNSDPKKEIFVDEKIIQSAIRFSGKNGEGTLQFDKTNKNYEVFIEKQSLDGHLYNEQKIKVAVFAKKGYVLTNPLSSFEIIVSGLIEKEKLTINSEKINNSISFIGKDGQGKFVFTKGNNLFTIELENKEQDGYFSNGQIVNAWLIPDKEHDWINPYKKHIQLEVKDLEFDKIKITKIDHKSLTKFVGIDGKGKFIFDKGLNHYNVSLKQGDINGELSNGQTITLILTPEENYIFAKDIDTEIQVMVVGLQKAQKITITQEEIEKAISFSGFNGVFSTDDNHKHKARFVFDKGNKHYTIRLKGYQDLINGKEVIFVVIPDEGYELARGIENNFKVKISGLEETEELNINNEDIESTITFSGKNGEGTFSFTKGEKLFNIELQDESLNGSLSNGQKVKIRLFPDKNHNWIHGQFRDFTITVRGLEVVATEKQIRDSIKFSGTDEKGSFVFEQSDKNYNISLKNPKANGKLVNGQKVTLIISPNKDYVLPKNFNNEIEVLVSGLTKLEEIPISREEIKALPLFSSINGEGKFSFVKENKHYDIVLKNHGLNGSFSNGDKVKVLVVPDEGYKLTNIFNEEVEIVVAGLIDLQEIKVTQEEIEKAVTFKGFNATHSGSYDEYSAKFIFKKGNKHYTLSLKKERDLINGENVTIVVIPDEGYKLSKDIKNEFLVNVSGLDPLVEFVYNEEAAKRSISFVGENGWGNFVFTKGDNPFTIEFRENIEYVDGEITWKTNGRFKNGDQIDLWLTPDKKHNWLNASSILIQVTVEGLDNSEEE